MVIEKININKIENSLKRVSEESSKLKVLQQDLDNINKNLKEVNFNFLSGKVSNQVYQVSKKSLEKKRKFLIDKVNKNINSILTIVKGLSEVINENKV
jgi:NCAIR mutase (PurE)-related protein